MKIHPAYGRFHTKNPSRRILLIWGPRAMGTEAFALSWVAGIPSNVVDLSAQTAHGDITEQVAQAGRTTERVAVILPPGAQASALAATYSAALAGPNDLCLTYDEVETWLTALEATANSDARELYRAGGGWFEILQELVSEQANSAIAGELLDGSLGSWLDVIDHKGLMSAAGFLDAFDEMTLNSYYDNFSVTRLSADSLLRHGLLCRDERGELVMPHLVSGLLNKRCRSTNQLLADRLEEHAIASIAETTSVYEALKTAVSCGRWNAALSLLDARAVDLFLESPEQLREVISLLPRKAMDSKGYLWWILNVVDASVPSGLRAPNPSPTVGYAYTKALQHLRGISIQAAKTPGPAAITTGMVYLLLLRFSGRYAESAQQARAIQDVLHAAMVLGPVSELLVGFTYVQVGASHMMSGNVDEAIWSFEEASRSVNPEKRQPLDPTINGALALLHALNGQNQRAQDYLDSFEPVAAAEARWDLVTTQTMVRAAQGLLYLSQLDVERLGNVVRELPREPSQNHLWFFHVFLDSWHVALRGDRTTFMALRNSAPFERSPLDQSRLIQSLFGEIVQLGDVLWLEGSGVPDFHPLRALGLIRRSRNDAALAVLKKFDSSVPGFGRWRTVVVALSEAVRDSSGELSGMVQRVQRTSLEVSPLDSALMSTVPNFTDSAVLWGFDDIVLRRIKRFAAMTFPSLPARPILTHREKELISYLRQGYSRKNIAEQTFRSENTIKSQMSTLYRKLSAKSSKQALGKAKEYGY